MSKKETEFDRYERMVKLQRERDTERRKELYEEKKMENGSKIKHHNHQKKWIKIYQLGLDDYEL